MQFKDFLVVEEPIRYKIKVKTGRRTDIIQKGISKNIVEEMNFIRNNLKTRELKVIFPTMSPISFKTYNNYILNFGDTNKLLWRHRCQHWQRDLKTY